MVVCAEIDPQVADPEADAALDSAQHRRWQERFSRAWRQVTRDVAPGIPTAGFSSEVVCLLPANVQRDRLGHDVVRRVVEAVAATMAVGGGRSPSE